MLSPRIMSVNRSFFTLSYILWILPSQNLSTISPDVSLASERAVEWVNLSSSCQSSANKTSCTSMQTLFKCKLHLRAKFGGSEYTRSTFYCHGDSRDGSWYHMSAVSIIQLIMCICPLLVSHSVTFCTVRATSLHSTLHQSYVSQEEVFLHQLWWRQRAIEFWAPRSNGTSKEKNRK